jgi:hypothetical protein
MLKPTGLKGPDSDRSRGFATRLCVDADLPDHSIQLVARIRDQGLPNCVGEALGGRWQGLTGFDCSGRDIWREAQRQESWQTERVSRFDPAQGAYLEYAIDGVIRRGLTPYRSGEEQDQSAALERWTEGYNAGHRRPIGAEAYRIDPGDLDSLRIALCRGMGVFDGGGVTTKLMQRGSENADTPAGLDELGGDRNGHSQGIFGFWFGSPVGDVLYYQNSWGLAHAGCFVPVFGTDGTLQHMSWQPGCYLAWASTFVERWDCWAIAPQVFA